MNLSRHFTLEEMSFSNTARTLGIDNTPTADAAQSLRALCTAVLDPLRDALGSSIKVNSGYRGPALNARLKGAAKSQHLTGHAADIQAPGMTVVDLFKKVIQLKLPYDQLIYEVNGKSKWVHVSHNPGANRGVIMLGQFDAAGRVTFPRITAEQALAMSEPVTRSSGAAAPLSYIEGSDEPEDQAPAPKITRKPPAEAAAKTTPVKKTGADPRAAKKPAAGKGVAKKTAPRKATPQKTAAKKAVVKKVAAKKVAAKKAVVKKAAAKKPVVKKAAVKKTPSMVPAKSPAKRASR